MNDFGVLFTPDMNDLVHIGDFSSAHQAVYLAF